VSFMEWRRLRERDELDEKEGEGRRGGEEGDIRWFYHLRLARGR
jgi:hypothetical protein